MMLTLSLIWMLLEPAQPPTLASEQRREPTAEDTRPLVIVGASELQGFAEDDAIAHQEPVADGPTSAPAERPGDGSPRAEAGVVVREAVPQPPPERMMFRRSPEPPERSAAFVLGYRQFEIRDGLSRRQTWHMMSIEVTPVRRYVRLNLLTEFGWEGGEAAREGDRADFMLLQKAGLGLQYPYWVTPFVEFQGGAGVSRVELFERNDLVFVYTLGLDAGAQWAITPWLFLHGAVGWLRPVFRRDAGSVRYDRFAFKVGIGF